MPLTDLAIRSLKARSKPFKVSDGGGLHLLVSPSGGKLWRFSYRFEGKQKTLAFGAYPATSLMRAREKRENARENVAAGRDPAVEEKLKRLSERMAAAATFDKVAGKYVEKLRTKGRAERTLAKTEWLLSLASPSLGSRPIAEIQPAEVLAVLEQVEKRGRLETARRLRATLSAVFRLAIATAQATSDPAEPLRGALTPPKVKHRAAITDPIEFGGLLRAIEGYEGHPATRAALRLLPLVFSRPGELRAAHWDDFDLEKGIWTIPAERTKMRREHRAPLATQAVAILQELHPVTHRPRATGSGLAFPSVRSVLRPISENTLNAALRRLGYSKDEVTAHGFRSTASTRLNEMGFDPDVIEAALAHVDSNTIRRAYNRATYWDERVKMMQAWANWCDAARDGAKVIPLKSA